MSKKAFPVNNNARATSTWKCPKCEDIRNGFQFSEIPNSGIPFCGECDCDMDLVAVVIDGVSQTVK